LAQESRGEGQPSYFEIDLFFSPFPLPSIWFQKIGEQNYAVFQGH